MYINRSHLHSRTIISSLPISSLSSSFSFSFIALPCFFSSPRWSSLHFQSRTDQHQLSLPSADRRHQLISFSLSFLLHEPAAPAFTITTTLQPDDHHHLPTLISQSTVRLEPTAAVIDSSFSRSTLVDVWCLVQVVMFDVWCLVQYQHHLHPHRASSAWTISDQKHHLPHRLITIASCYCLPLLQLAIPVCVFLSGEPVTSEPGTLQHHQLVMIGCCLLLMWIDCCCQCLDRSYYPFGRLQHHQQPHLFL